MRNLRPLSFAYGLIAVVLTAAPYAQASAIDSPSGAERSSETTAGNVMLATHRRPPKPNGPRPQGSLPHRPAGAAAPAVPGHHDPAHGGHSVHSHGDPIMDRPTGNATRPKHKIMEKVHGAKEKVKSFGRRIKNKLSR
jgi:hypothetical protein